MSITSKFIKLLIKICFLPINIKDDKICFKMMSVKTFIHIILYPGACAVLWGFSLGSGLFIFN